MIEPTTASHLKIVEPGHVHIFPAMNAEVWEHRRSGDQQIQIDRHKSSEYRYTFGIWSQRHSEACVLSAAKVSHLMANLDPVIKPIKLIFEDRDGQVKVLDLNIQETTGLVAVLGSWVGSLQ
jgi:hypothetical protein